MVVIIPNNILKFESFAKDRKRIITVIYLVSNLERPKVRDKIEKNNVNSQKTIKIHVQSIFSK